LIEAGPTKKVVRIALEATMAETGEPKKEPEREAEAVLL